MNRMDLKLSKTTRSLRLPGFQAILSRETRDGQALITIALDYNGAYGMGEKFDSLNQKGRRVVNRLEEKFCFQGEHTYCPAPFFWTDTGFGLYVQTDRETVFDFGEDSILVSCPEDADVFLCTGSPEQMIREYQAMFGSAKLPPKWAFAPWISANCWNSQADVEEQLARLEQYGFPASVLVVEAWSDEATFYIFNGAEYTPVPDGKALCYEDFDFSNSLWPDPKGLIQKLHAEGVRFVLWQCPVYKKQGPDEIMNVQNDLDRADAENRRLCVQNSDGTPYTIPNGRWFGGSMIPDFTNPETVESWFGKRRYLLDIGVDGFKTDGGEFIYAPDAVFYDGSTGLEGKNRYARDYTAAYTEFIGSSHVLFSRAGYAGQHTTPILWAGDQQSQNSELKGVLSAGLSAALTGIPFWSFDIGGFAGPLPTPDLYRRATQLACFCPVMQWHAEPPGGQFKELMPGADGNNERSPWNMAKAAGDDGYLDEMRFWHNLRMNLLPYLYSTALECTSSGRPMMRPLVYEWPDDKNAIEVEDEFLLGESLLVAPVIEEHGCVRRVYLPAGSWVDFFSGVTVCGEQWIETACDKYISVYQRCGYGVALNLNDSLALGSFVGNRTDRYEKLHFLLAGVSGTTTFSDDLGNSLMLRWKDGAVMVEGKASFPYSWDFI